MIKKLILVFTTIICLQLTAQQGTASPYSLYGIGNFKFKGTVENASMGGLSIYTDSIHMNFQNPASYAGKNLTLFNNESRPVKFTVAGTYSSVNLKTNTEKTNTSASSFDYLGLSIPLGKFGVGIGLLPYTSVGYKLDSNNSKGLIGNRSEGTGGVNKVIFGLGYQLTNHLSIGIDGNYNFGKIDDSTIRFIYDDNDELIQFQSRENNSAILSAFNINLGLNYKRMLSSKLELTAGATYTPSYNLTTKNENSFSTITINVDTNQQAVINTIESDLEALGIAKTIFKLPSKYSFGIGFGQPHKWFAGVEYFGSESFSLGGGSPDDNFVFEKSFKSSFGGFFIPKYNSFSSYWKRVTYRAGFHYEDTGLRVNNKTIEEFGISFGVGLPVGNLFSNVNLGIELGKRGTTSGNLIEEKFVNFRLSLSLNDRWFQKRKYN